MKNLLISLILVFVSVPFAQASTSIDAAPVVKSVLNEVLTDLSGYGFQVAELLEGQEALAPNVSCGVFSSEQTQVTLVNLIAALVDDEIVSGDFVTALSSLLGASSYKICEVDTEEAAGVVRTFYFNEFSGSLNFAIRYGFIE